MTDFSVELKEAFGKFFFKVKLSDISKLRNVQELLNKLPSIDHVNITENKRHDLTIRPTGLYTPEETENEIRLLLSSFFTTQPLDPIFEDGFSKISFKAYHQIIDKIICFGKNLERFQFLNQKVNEPELRDLFVFFLNSISSNHFASGETFNKKGKADILIQDNQGVNVFIAECKVWHGEKELLDAVDQLLNLYVNWRDELTALIIFNRMNKSHSKVIRSAIEAIQKHKNYFSCESENTDISYSYVFKNLDDNNKKINLELIIFNFT